MSRKMKGVNVGFLNQITGQRTVQQKDRTWWCVVEEKVLKKARIQSLGDYIDRCQATVAEWLALRPILEVCDRDTGYKGGGRRQEPWWQKNLPESS